MFLTVILDRRSIRQNYSCGGFDTPMPLEASLRGCVGGVDSARIVRAAISAHYVLFFALMPRSGRCGVSPLEGAARNKVRARGRLPPLIKPKANERA